MVYILGKISSTGLIYSDFICMKLNISQLKKFRYSNFLTEKAGKKKKKKTGGKFYFKHGNFGYIVG